LQPSQEAFKLLLYGDSEVQEPGSGQKIEEHVFSDLDICNDENRPTVV